MNKRIFTSIIIGGLLLSGCGDSGSGSTTNTSTTISGQLVDSYISNVTYTCNDGTTGITDSIGTFTCKSLPVSFNIGNIEIGSISTLNTDKQVFPQDLLSLERTNTTDTKLIGLTRFVQTLDTDNDASNGITCDNSQISKINENILEKESFDENKLANYESYIEEVLVTEEDAMAHLEETLLYIDKVSELELKDTVLDYVYSPKSTLNTEVIGALTYMGNEERLAYDVYNELYKVTTVKQLNNIATNSEISHINSIRAMLFKYDIVDTELYNKGADELIAGVYEKETIQGLYDTLYEKGIKTTQDSLEVGCMVEVVDVDDLDTYISQAEAINATDVVGVFDFLRNGSYNHYWAFDKGLKNIGVSTGCCSLGEEWCKTEEEYPKN